MIYYGKNLGDSAILNESQSLISSGKPKYKPSSILPWNNDKMVRIRNIANITLLHARRFVTLLRDLFFSEKHSWSQP